MAAGPLLAADETAPAAADTDKETVITVEDAEDAAAKAGDKWKVIRRIGRSNASVAYVYDEARKSRVVEFKSTGVPRARWIRDVWFTEMTAQKYAFKRDEVLANLRKEGLIEKDDRGNDRFVPKILALPDRYALRDHLKKLATPFTDDETTVTLSLWARCRETRRSKISVKIDRPIAEDEEVEVEWAMRFEPMVWNSKSFTVYVQVEADAGVKHMFHYLKATHATELANQGEEKGYKWAKRDVIFYWRQLDAWAKETGPISRGRYVRALLDDQLAKQKPVNGWYQFRCNLSQNLRDAKSMYSIGRDGKPRRKLQNARITKVKSVDVAAGDCRIDDVRIIVRKK